MQERLAELLEEFQSHDEALARIAELEAALRAYYSAAEAMMAVAEDDGGFHYANDTQREALASADSMVVSTMPHLKPKQD